MTYAIMTTSRVYGPAPFVAFEFKTKAKALQAKARAGLGGAWEVKALTPATREAIGQMEDKAHAA